MRRSPLLVIFITVFIDLVGFGIVIPVLPFYAEGTIFNATPRTVGLLFASYSVMQLIFSPVLGGLSDKYGRRPVLFLSIIGPGIGGILSRWGIQVPFFFAAGLCFANAALLYFTLPETITPDHPARHKAG